MNFVHLTDAQNVRVRVNLEDISYYFVDPNNIQFTTVAFRGQPRAIAVKEGLQFFDDIFKPRREILNGN